MRRVMLENGRMLIALLVVFAGISLALFRLTHISDVFSARATTWSMNDFWGVVYYPVVAFLNGENPYDTERFLALYPVSEPFPLYLPAVLLVHLPIGLLPAQAASIVYFMLTIALTFLLVFVCLSLNKIKIAIADILFIGGLLLLSRPGHGNLLLGQPTLQVVLASYVALSFARRSAIISGLGLAVSMINPTFGIPLALLMLTQRYIRQVFYGAIIIIPINLFFITVLLYRSGGIDHFLEVLINNHHVLLNDVTVNPVSSHAVDINTFISHFIGKPLNYIVQLAILVSVLGVASWALRPTAGPNDERFHTLSIGIVCLATLLSVHHQVYDLLLLTLPCIGLVFHRFPHEFYSSYRYGLSTSLLTILALNYTATNAVIPFGRPAGGLWLVLVSINSIALLVLFFIWIRAAHLVRLNAAASSDAWLLKAPPRGAFSIAQSSIAQSVQVHTHIQ